MVSTCSDAVSEDNETRSQTAKWLKIESERQGERKLINFDLLLIVTWLTEGDDSLMRSLRRVLMCQLWCLIWLNLSVTIRIRGYLS